MKPTSLIISALILSHSLIAYSFIAPDPKLTKGVLCTPVDSDFTGFDYPSKVARCKRNIMDSEKVAVAKAYGNIPRTDWPKYEFDHYLPLCAGGSNNIQNLWPQPISEAKQKDVIEVQVCSGLKAGTMTQDVALQKINDWFKQRQIANTSLNTVQLQQFDSLIQSQLVKSFECDQIQTDQNLPLNIKVNFDVISNSSLQNIKVTLIEKNAETEFLNEGSLVVTGKLSKAVKTPLNQLCLYSIKNNKDRFDIYLPQDFVLKENAWYGYFKISFEDTYPQLITLSCHANQL
ncbi:MAG: hypothetical protein H7235_06350 [Bdellovibrionaceae bacterium]|nr:hypothetical protein [Pseudobdellovibrionaceae bacterium]